ncbi:hypothetical protein FS320_29735 [Microvirga tunisiensis]|uniref:Uncharacterized protein n=1 Tax=Microvirga tunisiensis TaxID=2108360 RepID=A0A5N7MR89_9HYPH|nr:hypothetical protein [Microvirga tunisiensis]MPR29170.1 hypothetical protein [Microvirga tunisiensis]
MTAVSATKMLLRIRENAAVGEPLSGEAARYFVVAVDEWLSGTEFAEAFGVKPARGEADPRRTMIESQRDELIRTAAQRFLRYIPLRQRAEELHRAWTRYFDGAWHTRDRKLSECPEHYSGKPERLLFHITSLKPHVLSERQIRRILAAEPPGSVATELCSNKEIRRRRPKDAAITLQGSGAMHGAAIDAGVPAHPSG